MEQCVIDFGICTASWLPHQRKFVARFPDGTEAHGIPHDTDDYRAHATEKSTGCVNTYCWQHDLFHIIHGLIHGGPSKVLWAVAHGLPLDTPECEQEEREVQELQKKFFLRSN